MGGVNSWSPSKCDDKRVLDVFVDVGSLRHWIEDNKPTTEKYIVGLHLCNDQTVDERGKSTLKISEAFKVVLYGSNDAESFTLSLNDEVDSQDGFYVFRFDINNIGWMIEGIEFVPLNDDDDICFDFAVAGQLDTPQLFSGVARQFWISDGEDEKIELSHSCVSNNEVEVDEMVIEENEEDEDGKMSEK